MTLVHTLLTMQCNGFSVHGYLMCSASEVREISLVLAEEMQDIAKQHNIPVLPVVLMTKLGDSGVATVREVISRYPEVVEKLKTSIDFHRTIWGMPADEPGYESIMALH